MWRQTTVQKWISNDKFITHLSNYDKIVSTSVANVATERMWLDTTGLDQVCPTFLPFATWGDKYILKNIFFIEESYL